MVAAVRAARGCEMCRHTGYKGRIGFYELMMMNAEMAEMIVRRAPLTDLKEAAKANGMKELREDGLIKVLRGHDHARRGHARRLHRRLLSEVRRSIGQQPNNSRDDADPTSVRTPAF